MKKSDADLLTIENLIGRIKQISAEMDKLFLDLERFLSVEPTCEDGKMDTNEEIRYLAGVILQEITELGLKLVAKKKGLTDVMSIDSDW